MNRGLARSIQLVNEISIQLRVKLERVERSRRSNGSVVFQDHDLAGGASSICTIVEQVIRGDDRDSKGHELPYVRDRICRYQSIFGR